MYISYVLACLKTQVALPNDSLGKCKCRPLSLTIRIDLKLEEQLSKPCAEPYSVEISLITINMVTRSKALWKFRLLLPLGEDPHEDDDDKDRDDHADDDLHLHVGPELLPLHSIGNQNSSHRIVKNHLKFKLSTI